MAKTHNPALRRMGLAADERALLIHADDIGMGHTTLPALAEVMAFGIVTSCAVMVPAPWFPQAAALLREHPGWDVGLHATLTAEWTASRWRPISTSDPATGLLDPEGFFPRRCPELRGVASPDAVRAEVRAQLEVALAAGLDISHIDMHMFAPLDARLFAPWLDVALQAGIPPLLMRRGDMLRLGASEDGLAALLDQVDALEAAGWPVFDSVRELPLRDPEGQVALARRMIDETPPGLHLLIAHPASDTPELRALVPHWEARVANREALLSVSLRDTIRLSGVRLISYRDVRRAAPLAHRR
ncbi:MAG: ChbG/HpnK family deacetylase [Anaerolineae bacterium]|jgi:predicted glycoside hydrolase/deacetylase ChbG (UPF0249 family)|nr:ChbG/HpnK family deacetylase [Chloroflexota bacterium]